MKILLAVNREDAERYIKGFPELADARISYIVPGRLEGLRVSEAYATPEARYHEAYKKAYRILYHSFALGRNGPPRII